ncbi:MAG: hypothetical protein AAGK05_11190 [Pseudomonadota bacterium]
MALLDMSNIPNQMISGLSSDELQWITEENLLCVPNINIRFDV